MAENEDEWLWETDDEPIQAPLRVEEPSPQAAKAPVKSAEVVSDVGLHVMGMSDDAL